MLVSREIITVNQRRYIRIPKLIEAGLNHVFTSIDIDMKVTDSEADGQVADHLQNIYQDMQIYPEEYYFMKQEHTDWVSIVDEPHLGRKYDFGYRVMGVDGLITAQHNYVLCSTEADCVPVLIYDPVRQAHANVHSGWKSTLHKITERAIKYMKMAYETDPADLLIGVGPHIHHACYEVQHDVSDLFSGVFQNYDEIILHDENGKMTLDLAKAIETTLLDAGVLAENIYTADLNTFAEKDLLHSFRRDQETSGLMGTLSTLMQPGEYYEAPEEE